jgi:hypothetical protein
VRVRIDFATDGAEPKTKCGFGADTIRQGIADSGEGRIFFEDTDYLFTFGAAAYNLVRWRKLVAQQAYRPRRPMNLDRDDFITIIEQGNRVLNARFSAPLSVLV